MEPPPLPVIKASSQFSRIKVGVLLAVLIWGITMPIHLFDTFTPCFIEETPNDPDTHVYVHSFYNWIPAIAKEIKEYAVGKIDVKFLIIMTIVTLFFFSIPCIFHIAICYFLALLIIHLYHRIHRELFPK